MLAVALVAYRFFLSLFVPILGFLVFLLPGRYDIAATLTAQILVWSMLWVLYNLALMEKPAAVAARVRVASQIAISQVLSRWAFPVVSL